MQVLRLVIRLYETVESPDWVDICQCLMFLDDAPEVAKILSRLITGSEVRRLGGRGGIWEAAGWEVAWAGRDGAGVRK